VSGKEERRRRDTSIFCLGVSPERMQRMRET
jgi:hypothetical protein